MNPANKVDCKLILEIYFPTVIANIILLYKGKYDLLYINTFESNSHNFIKNVYGKSLLIENTDMWDIIDDNTILLYNYANSVFKIFSIKRNEIIKTFRVDTKKYCRDNDYYTSDGKYIIFGNGVEINIFGIPDSDIDTLKLINTIYPKYHVTKEARIVDDIIYTTVINRPIILKYKISGEYIGYICLSKEYRKTVWSSVYVAITNNEIVMLDHYRLLFYDIDGDKIGEYKINKRSISIPSVTSDYVFIKSCGSVDQYRRF
jgi:hypothetical protein